MARPARARHPQHRRLTILKLDRLGDFVLALGAIRRLVEHFGSVNCRLLVSPFAAPLAAREFPAVERIVLPAFAPRLRNLLPLRRQWRRRLAEMSSDDVVCLRHQVSAYRDMVLGWLPAGRRIALHGPQGEQPAVVIPRLAPGLAYPARPEPGQCLELEAHRIVVSEALGRKLPAAAIAPAMAGPSSSEPAPAVVIAPFAGAAIRDLPEALIGRIIAAMPAPPDAAVVLTGAPEDRTRLQALASRCPAPAGRVVVASGSVEDLIARVARARLVISAESATAHLATALDRPLVCLLGGGHFGLLAPWSRSSRQRWLHHPLPCYQCDWACPHSEPWCISRISADEVLVAVGELLRTAE